MSNVYSVKNIEGQFADEEGSVSLQGIFKSKTESFYTTTTVNFTLSAQYFPFYTVFTAINPIICNIPLHSEVPFQIGSTQKFISTNSSVTYQGAGITFVGDVLTFEKGSVVVLTKLGNNTWSVSGTKTKLSQFKNDIYATEPYTVYINTVSGNDSTGQLGLFSNPYKTDAVAYANLPVDDGNPWTFVYLCSNVSRNIIFPQNRRIRFKTDTVGTFNLVNWTGFSNNTTEVYFDAPNTDIIANHSSQNSVVVSLPVYINVNNFSMVNTDVGGVTYWLNTNEQSLIKINVASINMTSNGVKIFNLGNININKLETNRLICEANANATISELMLTTGTTFFAGQFPINKFKCLKLSGTGTNIGVENIGLFDVTNLEVSAGYLIRSYGILTGTMGSGFIGLLQLGFQASNVVVRRFVGKFASWTIDASASDNLTIEDSTIYLDRYLFRTNGFVGTRNWYFKNVELIATNTTGLVEGSSVDAKLIINKTGFVRTNSVFDTQTTFTEKTLTDFGEINQIIISSTLSINSDTKDTATGKISQNGKNVLINNGNNSINYTINSGLVASFTKIGTAQITFLQGAGRTLIQVDGTNVLNGAVGSTATITSNGNTDYLRISNA